MNPIYEMSKTVFGENVQYIGQTLKVPDGPVYIRDRHLEKPQKAGITPAHLKKENILDKPLLALYLIGDGGTMGIFPITARGLS